MRQWFEKMKINFKIYRVPGFIFIFSRIMVLLTLLLVYSYNFKEAPSLYQWDAKSYLSIAENGYQFNGTYEKEGSLIAFFPLYPIAIFIFHSLTNLSFEISGLILSFFFGLGAALLLYRLVFDWRGQAAAETAVALFSFFPSSIFLSSVYSESLFIFLVLLTFYLTKRKRELSALLAVALSTVTRITGSILALVFIWELWQKTKSMLKVIASGLLISIPFVIFLYFQFIQYSTPFAFLNVQSLIWHSQAVWPWTGLKIFFSYVFTENYYNAMWRTSAVYLIMMMITLVLSFKKIPRAIWLFGLGVMVLTLCNSFIMSLERFMLLVLPFYFYFGEVLSKHKLAGQMALIFSAGWMVFNTVLFVLSDFLL